MGQTSRARGFLMLMVKKKNQLWEGTWRLDRPGPVQVRHFTSCMTLSKSSGSRSVFPSEKWAQSYPFRC